MSPLAPAALLALLVSASACTPTSPPSEQRAATSEQPGEPAPPAPAPAPAPAAPAYELATAGHRDGRGLAPLARHIDELDTVCEVLAEHACPTAGTDPCTCTIEARDEGQGWARALLRPRDGPELWHLAIRTADSWTVFEPLIRTKTTGIWGYYEELEWSAPTTEALLEGGEAELVLRLTKLHESADNAGLPTDAGLEWGLVAVCTRDEGQARCTRALIDAYTYERQRPDAHREQLEDLLELGPVLVASSTEPATTMSDHGFAVLDALELPAGTHPLADLLAPGPAVEPPDEDE